MAKRRVVARARTAEQAEPTALLARFIIKWRRASTAGVVARPAEARISAIRLGAIVFHGRIDDADDGGRFGGDDAGLRRAGV